MSDRLRIDRALRGAAVLCCIAGAGCTALERSPPAAEPAVTAVPALATPPAPPATVEPPASAPVIQSAPAVTTTVPTPPATAAASPGSSPRTTSGTKPVPVAPPTKPPAPVTVSPAPAPTAPVAVPRPVGPKPAAASPPAPPLDLAALEVRLRETKAIGVMTKLSLKNQVDDLLDKFRAYYKRQSNTSLAELRRPYDMLLLKVLSLLQDSDPPLARDIVASREAIWGVLADPQKFNEAKLMAGDTP